jgi:hypothetical protein
MMNRTLTALSLLALGTSLGCAKKGANSQEGTGQLEVAITAAPEDGTCIQILVAGANRVEKDVDVKPGQSTVLSLDGLPLGAVTVTVNAYAGKCAALSSTSIATWVGDPATTTLLPAVLGKVAIVLHRNGRLAVSVDFDEGSLFPPKCMECLKSKCAPFLMGGCDTLKDAALEGPATGASKKQLCNETLACVVATHCGNAPALSTNIPADVLGSPGDLSVCYCGAVPGTPCVDDGLGTGPCKLVLERAYEAVQPLDVPVRFHDATFAGGVAMNLLACASDSCSGCL